MEKNSISIVDCSVEYNGRARSTLERGKYLIIYKGDGSVAIHGATKNKPLNYLGSNTNLTVETSTITWKTKKESITIQVYEMIHTHQLDLASNAPVVTRTEKQLVDKLVANWETLIGRKSEIVREKQTQHGPIDIYAVDQNGQVIVEAKRKNATLKDITQVLRYKEAFEGTVECYVAAPGISNKAAAYAEKHQVRFLQVNFD